MLLVNNLIGFGAGDQYAPGEVNFDGSTYLTRDGGLTSVADSKMMTIAGRFRSGSDTAVNRILFCAVATLGGTALRFYLMALSNHRFALIGTNSAASTILDIRSTTNVLQVADGWVHFMASVDMADTAKRHLYVNGVSDLNSVNTYTDDTLDFTWGDWGVGGEPDGTQPWTGDMADLLFWPGVYTDLSVAGNRALFITGGPVHPDVAIASLGTPAVQLSGATASWHTNKGSGGGFTENGTLTDAA